MEASDSTPVTPDVPVVEKAADPTITPQDLVAEHTKAELQTAADELEVTVAAGDNKIDIAEKLVEAVPAPAPKLVAVVRVDGRTRRSDDDALEGLFCEIIAGEYQGERGVFDSVAVSDPETGYPKRIRVVNRDHTGGDAQFEVDYKDVRPTTWSGGR